MKYVYLLIVFLVIAGCAKTTTISLPIEEKQVSVEATIKHELDQRIRTSSAQLITYQESYVLNESNTTKGYFVLRNAYAVPKTFLISCDSDGEKCELGYNGTTIQPKSTAFNYINISGEKGQHIYTITITDTAQNFYARERVTASVI